MRGESRAPFRPFSCTPVFQPPRSLVGGATRDSVRRSHVLLLYSSGRGLWDAPSNGNLVCAVPPHLPCPRALLPSVSVLSPRYAAVASLLAARCGVDVVVGGRARLLPPRRRCHAPPP